MALRKNYHGNIFIKPVTTVDGFIKEWNNMDESKTIDYVMIMIHGYPEYLTFIEDIDMLFDGDDGRFNELKSKKINSLLLLCCNSAGALKPNAASPYNLATSFSKIEGVRAVLASDGLVQSHINPITGTVKFKSLADRIDENGRNGSFVIYSNGKHSSTLLEEEYNLSDLLVVIDNHGSLVASNGMR